MDIPPDALTVTASDTPGGGSAFVLSADTANPVTVLTVGHFHEGGGQSTLSCGSVTLSLLPFQGTIGQTDVRYVCTDDLTLTTSVLSTRAGVSVTYVPYNFTEVFGGVVETTQPWMLIRQWDLGSIATVAVLIPIGAALLWIAIMRAFRKPVGYRK